MSLRALYRKIPESRRLCVYCDEPILRNIDRDKDGRLYHHGCTVPDAIISGDFKPISQIAEGERCLEGINSLVLGTQKRDFDGRMVTIKGRGTLPLSLTPEHPLLVITGDPSDCGVKLSEPYWKIAQYIQPKKANKTGDYLLIPRVCGSTEDNKLDLKGFLRDRSNRGLKGAQTKWKKKNPISLELPLSEDFAWLLGLYIADGASSKRSVEFYLGCREIDIIEKTRAIIARLGYTPKIRKRKNQTYVLFQSAIVKRALQTWCGKGATNKRIPNFVLYHKKLSLLESLLKGYLAGDGAEYDSDGITQFSAATVSRTLALQLQLLCARLGYVLSIAPRNNSSTDVIQNRIVNCNPVYAMYTRCKTPHKFSATKINEKYVITPVTSASTCPYKGTVHNLQTSTQTYLIHNIIVHNCLLDARAKQYHCLECNVTFDWTEATLEAAEDSFNEEFQQRKRVLCPHCGTSNFKMEMQIEEA